MGRRRTQVDHRAVLGEEPAVLFGEDRAAAGRNDDIRAPYQLSKQLGFARPKASLTLNLEDHRNLDTRGALDFLVRVVKRLVQALRERPADRGLARAHQAD